jgi:hypothetical protein
MLLSQIFGSMGYSDLPCEPGKVEKAQAFFIQTRSTALCAVHPPKFRDEKALSNLVDVKNWRSARPLSQGEVLCSADKAVRRWTDCEVWVWAELIKSSKANSIKSKQRRPVSNLQ